MAGDEKDRKPYIKPEVIEELDLETRAGSPASADPANPLEL
jgi:hypothetical protein